MLIFFFFFNCQINVRFGKCVINPRLLVCVRLGAEEGSGKDLL